MEYNGIIITGTSGSGKTTIAETLCAKANKFEIVKAVTTRAPRPGTEEPNYSFVDKQTFSAYEEKKEFIVSTKYRNEKYGILLSDFLVAINNNKIPVLIISPESTKNTIIVDNEIQNFLSFFIDAQDNELEERLTGRGGKNAQSEIENRNFDREFKPYSLFYLINCKKSIDGIVDLINSLWNVRHSGGVIPNQIIQSLIEYGSLIEPYSEKNISAASYDLTLGVEYFQNGKISELTDKVPTIVLKPGDFIIAQSFEKVNLPNCISAKFDLTVSMFCKGLILSNGPQVDPGFSGKLFCLLFNTSNDTIELKKGEHYATIEFYKLVEPTDKPYVGKYQNKDKIMQYLPKIANYSVISHLKTEIEGLKKEAFWLKYTPLAISLLALIFTIYKLIQG
ncbi:MAG: AAA family ATPase [Bacteroidota bacterium]